MKQKLIALAVGTAVLAPAVSMAEPTWYGIADVSLDMVDNGTDDSWAVSSNSSRIGIKGKQDLDNGLTAVYKAEYEIYIDDGTDGTGDELKKRNIYAGLEGGFGQVIAGTFDTPAKKVQGKIDLFKDHAADIKKISTSEVRNDNTIQYKSPKIADAFEVKVAIAPGEGPGTDDDGIADETSISVTYGAGPLYAGVAIDSDINNTISGTITTDDRTVFALGYNMDNLMFGFLYEDAESADGMTEYDAWLISGGFQAENILFKAQFGAGEVDGGMDQDIFAIGLDYAMAEKTKAYVEFTGMTMEVGTTDTDMDTFAVGLQHKF